MSTANSYDFSEKLMVSSPTEKKASDKIPIIARPFVSDRAKETLDIVSRYLMRSYQAC